MTVYGTAYTDDKALDDLHCSSPCRRITRTPAFFRGREGAKRLVIVFSLFLRRVSCAWQAILVGGTRESIAIALGLFLQTEGGIVAFREEK